MRIPLPLPAQGSRAVTRGWPHRCIACFGLVLLLAVNTAFAANDRGLLLEATKEKKTVYLLGSIHLADESFYPLRETIEQAYRESDVLVVEADVLAMESDPLLQQKVMLESLYPPGEQLKDHISAEVYAQLQQWLKKRRIPEANFNRMRPAIAMITLSLIEMQARGLDPKAGIDRHFLSQAHRDNARILELESVLQQIEMLNSLENPELYLKQTLEQVSDMDRFVPRLTRAWKKGEQSDIYDLVIREGLAENPEYAPLFELLFYQRNREMAKKIQEFSERHNTLFVVVGAGHLVGAKSVTEYLEQAGFSVQQI
ncbi:TraB/GumN family protein [Microbulbifer salipaludis]|uniref:TraB/GumN family protein n=1 Tax=Microbulbifer salipaludis TaxID=187980 RepID=A0ABS3E7F1_9GAMM|nr:TraB/GumN family protein [Microbulbifer salipaludis]MBN8431239.1 TraB/GumN family protein [Microbulbifer salipaludis]